MSNKPCNIVHLTTVHPRDDSRIRFKEIVTLSGAFGEGGVKLYVQDGRGDEDVNSQYEIVDTGPRLRRIARMTVGAWRMIASVFRARPVVAHFHDPELLPWALLLRLRGIKVVYDVHEDVPRQVRHNPGLPAWARWLLPPFVSLTEWIGGQLVDGVVAATPVIAARFPKKKTVLVRNFPLLAELHDTDPTPFEKRPLEFTYVGSISENRNILGMIDAVRCLPQPDARLRLAGKFSDGEIQRRAEEAPGWSRVRFDGWTDRAGVARILADGRAGLVVLKPVAHEMLSLPIKLFEYMAAGMPVISSDFPVWREIVDSARCGLLVDPTNGDALVRAMQWMLDNPQEAQAMGERGRRAVVERYNWSIEASTLVEFYRDHIGISASIPSKMS